MHHLLPKAGLALAFVFLATTANAANADVHQWDGFYVGANFGWAWEHRHGTSVLANSGATLNSARKQDNGVTGGGQIGFNHIIGPAWLIGVEADLAGADLQKAKFGNQNIPAKNVGIFGTARGRLGYSDGRGVAYATGGLAWAHEEASRTQVTGIFNNATAGTRETDSKIITGWAAGAGIEHAIYRRITVKFEYLHIDLGSNSFSFPLSETRIDGHARYDIARIGMNFRL